jgi:hypothetical protein
MVVGFYVINHTQGKYIIDHVDLNCSKEQTIIYLIYTYTSGNHFLFNKEIQYDDSLFEFYFLYIKSKIS